MSAVWEPPKGRLGEIVAYKKARWAGAEGLRRAGALPREPGGQPRRKTPGLADAIRTVRQTGRVPIIAEVKRRSPSAGLIAPDTDAAARAAVYGRSGVAAVSVLADEAFFGGSPEDVEAVSRTVGLPVLYKDVVVSPAQVELARHCGAAAVLLIAAALAPHDLRMLLDTAYDLGLDAIVEVHDGPELDRVLEMGGVRIIGVNNRDLQTFEVDMQRALRLLPRIPGEVVAIAESGYRSAQQMAEAWAAGADAVLVGEALMRSPDPEALVREAREAYARLGEGLRPRAATRRT